MLFSLYMNDLPAVVKYSKIESYVDDNKLYLSFAAKDVDVCLHQVDEDLHRVAEWCCANRLLINPGKTKLILFGVSQFLSRVPSNISISFLGQQLTPVTSVEDLGVILD